MKNLGERDHNDANLCTHLKYYFPAKIYKTRKIEKLEVRGGKYKGILQK